MTQILNRISYMVSLGMLTRLESHIEKSRKVSGPRSLQCSHWGFICPVDTPDGENCGLVKNLSILARISTNIDDSQVRKYLLALGVIQTGAFRLWEMDVAENDWYLVILNGRIVGGVQKRFNLHQKLKKLRARKMIHFSVSICSDPIERVIDICTDGSRLMRPLLNLRNLRASNLNIQVEVLKSVHSVVKYLKQIAQAEDNPHEHNIQEENAEDGNHSSSLETDSVNSILAHRVKSLLDQYLPKGSDVQAAGLIAGSLQRRSQQTILSILPEQLSARLRVLISDCLIQSLLENNILEYLDVNEMNNCMIAFSLSEAEPLSTHVEISYDSILGVIAGSSVPFPHHNQSPRNTYQCAMGKQSMGLIANNVHERMDTVLYRMVYPHKPIITTDIAKLTNYEKFPSGHNACIAVMSYSGYDIEDAVVINKASIEKGFGRSVVSRKYSVDINKQFLNLGRHLFMFYV